MSAQACIKVHTIKCDPDVFQAIWIGLKTFEIRVNDRDYQVGDSLHIIEFDPATNKSTWRSINKRIVYMLQGVYGLPKDLCVMQLE